MKRDVVFLRHILDAIDLVKEYTASGKDVFMSSSLHQDGVIRQLEIVGEATKRLSADLRASYPGVPWKRMAALRDVLVHDYMGIDRLAVWNVVEQDLPEVEREVRAILSHLQAD